MKDWHRGLATNADWVPDYIREADFVILCRSQDGMGWEVYTICDSLQEAEGVISNYLDCNYYIPHAFTDFEIYDNRSALVRLAEQAK